jgi:tetratricopeptide (TPR) repeat protein
MTILVSKVINFKSFLLAVLMCSFSCLSLAQSSNTKKQVQFVFDKLISVYGSAKSAPKCLVIKKAKFPVLPASYSTKNGPTIQIDEALYKVCQTFGKDSLNALAIVMSHELTHYYNDHTFCSDYAFANFKSNTPLKSKIGQASSSARIEKESEADIKGFFYAAAAGFEPHGLQGLLIGKIYTAYKLSDEQKGYPTKKERIAIANNAEKIAAQLYEYFKNGLIAIENKRYDEAIELFTKANSQVPFRENWNNIGIANTRKALILKENSEDEKLFSQKFLYPLEVENKSRLNKDVTRSLDDNSDEMLQLLKVAQKDFQEAIRLDPNFTKGYINLACVYDLLGNPNAAIGTIKDLKPIEQQKSTDAQRILAIAYFHDKQENKANDIWNELKI